MRKSLLNHFSTSHGFGILVSLIIITILLMLSAIFLTRQNSWLIIMNIIAMGAMLTKTILNDKK